MAYQVTDAGGNVVENGSTVWDFRGKSAVFCHVSRAPQPEFGKTGKVIVEEGTRRREYYDRVFDLTIVEIED